MKHLLLQITHQTYIKKLFSIYINLCQIHSLYKCQIFQLYNFYVLYVLNTSHKLYSYMKLYMVSELSISCVLFTLTPPPPVNVRAVRILLECILVTPVCHSVHSGYRSGRYASYWNAYLCLEYVCVFRVMFWGDQGTRRVERVNLDGTNRQTIIQDGLVWPNQLAFSYTHRSVHRQTNRLK